MALSCVDVGEAASQSGKRALGGCVALFPVCLCLYLHWLVYPPFH